MINEFLQGSITNICITYINFRCSFSLVVSNMLQLFHPSVNNRLYSIIVKEPETSYNLKLCFKIKPKFILSQYLIMFLIKYQF